MLLKSVEMITHSTKLNIVQEVLINCAELFLFKVG